VVSKSSFFGITNLLFLLCQKGLVVEPEEKLHQRNN
jgi:hypothetical protein